jgi:hypothetical protein
MRKVLGTCPHCPNSKHAAIRLPSNTPTATHPGDKISFDPQQLPCPVLGGFTHVVTMVDEATGHIDQLGTASKTNAAVTNGIQKVIHVTYNANGHRVNTLHGDAERINTSLALSSDLSALNSKSLTLANMHIELNALHRQLINVLELWYPTYLIIYHQKQHSSSSKVSGKLSIILFARLPLRSLETKPSMDLNYDEHQ